MPDFENFLNHGTNFFEGEDIILSKLFYALFGGLPNEKRLKGKFEIDKLAAHLIHIYKLENKPGQVRRFQNFQYNENLKFKPLVTHRNPGNVWLIILKPNFMVEIAGHKITMLTGSDIGQAETTTFEKTLASFRKNKNKKRPKFYMISNRFGGFDLDKFNVSDCKIEPLLHYNDDFKEFNQSVIRFLQDKQKHGLILLHGKSGTGKTSYIRYLISNVKRKFVFLPLHMANSLSSPELLPFLSENKNCILIIEDCEKLIIERDTGQDQNEIATLLNMSDGLLSDALGIKLVCTFNTPLSKIDPALMRKGRMVNRYEFKELDVNKALFLAEKHNLPYQGESPITIGDLFNITHNNNANDYRKKKIGFVG